MVKGETASDVKKNIGTTLKKILDDEGQVEKKKFVGKMILETGYGKKFILEVVQAMEDAGLCYLTGEGMIKKTREKKT